MKSFRCKPMSNARVQIPILKCLNIFFVAIRQEKPAQMPVFLYIRRPDAQIISILNYKFIFKNDICIAYKFGSCSTICNTKNSRENPIMEALGISIFNCFSCHNSKLNSNASFFLFLNTLANQAGLTPSTVYSILDPSRKDIGIVAIKKLCDGLEIDIKTFFDSGLFSDLEQEIK